jgi:hypothetical protein
VPPAGRIAPNGTESAFGRIEPCMRKLAERFNQWERDTRPVDAEISAALATRWEELPAHVRTPAQLIGRRIAGCEGTHGVFPACDFACKPCYHSVDANRVPVDGAHTRREVDAQMSYLRRKRGFGQHAQLIGGEVTLLSPEDHAATLEIMRRHGRMPMSMTHGDFDYDYLRALAVRPDGSPRFHTLSFAAHIDTTMRGRRGAPQPTMEAELQPNRAAFCAMFDRLRSEHGINAHLAHNMTVTPANVEQIPDVITASRSLGFRVFSFQPAAYLGNEGRWRDDYRTLTDNDVWARIERGAGVRLPYEAVAVGDLRCNRTTWGLYVDDRYVPLLDDEVPDDLTFRDHFFAAFPGAYLSAPRHLQALRGARAVLAHPAIVPAATRWAKRITERAGGARAFRHGARSVTFVMHNFMDARDVAPAWALLQKGVLSDDPQIRTTQERLQACSYHMAHPESDELVPACAQHSVYDPAENRELVTLLAPPTRRSTTRT